MTKTKEIVTIRGRMNSVPEAWGERDLPLRIETGKGKKAKRYLLIKTKLGGLLLNKG